MQNLPDGIHDGVPMRDYLLYRGLSASRLNTILQYSPFHAYHDEGGEPSDASDMGTAIHDALLEGIDRIAVIEADDWRTKAAKDARDNARSEGKIPILAHKVAQVTNAVDAAKRFIASSEIAGVFDDGKPEQTIIWKEGELICKARPDWLTDERDILLHVKTTQGSAEPSSWIRNQLVPAGYDVAAMFYEMGIFGIRTDKECHIGSQSVFLVIEQNAPYGCSLVGLAPAMMDLASRKVERGIRIWQQCKATGKYPSYPAQIHYAEPMPWHLSAEEEIQLHNAYDQLQEKEGLQA